MPMGSACSMVLADVIAKREKPPKIDRAALLEMALLHDLGEALTTDIPSPIKKFIGRDQVKAGEQRAIAAMVSDVEPRYLDLWTRYEAGACLESRIVHAADTIQMMVKVLQYESAGLGDLRRFWSGDMKDREIPEARLLLDRIRQYHDDGDWPAGI